MSLYLRFSSSFVGLFRGEDAKQKFLYLQQTKKQERRLKNFWQKKGLTLLDEIEIQTWHSH
jgi:hypothetical protein